MATTIGNFTLYRASSGSRGRRRTQKTSSSYQPATGYGTRSSLGDQYRTLQVQFGASISDVKKAFRQLALQYHPDVCKGSNCKVQFQNINEAYDVVMSNLREADEETTPDDGEMDGQDYDMWEEDEWMMGWEGAGVRDYANPYVYTT
ncbi:unnamed protein product [Rhodiola kirilowii]